MKITGAEELDQIDREDLFCQGMMKEQEDIDRWFKKYSKKKKKHDDRN